MACKSVSATRTGSATECTVHAKVPALRSLTVEQRREWFRDDCRVLNLEGERITCARSLGLLELRSSLRDRG